MGVNEKQECEAQEGEALRPQESRGDGLMSTPRQQPSWEKRGDWGKVAIISRIVEISIAGGVVAMVRGLYFRPSFFFFFF